MQFSNFAKTTLCNTRNKVVKNVPILQHCVTWPVTQCNDEKTLLSFRKEQIIANMNLQSKCIELSKNVKLDLKINKQFC